MKESERIDYLVSRLAGNNAKLFATKCGIDPKAISNIRHGKQRILSYSDRIAKGYPEVSMDWLLTGKGRPIKTDEERPEILRRLDAIEKRLGRIEKIITRE